MYPEQRGLETAMRDIPRSGQAVLASLKLYVDMLDELAVPKERAALKAGKDVPDTAWS